MTPITIAEAVQMQSEFAAMHPPASVMRAVNIITTLAAVGGKVPTDLVSYVQSWIAKQQRQDRYGKESQ